MSNDLFDTPASAPLVDQNKNYIEELVGEGRKFKTIEDLAKGKAEADAYIATLVAQRDELTQELNTRANLQDLLTKLSEKPTPAQTPQPPAGFEAPPAVSSGLSAAELDKMISDRLAEREQTNTREQNAASVKTTLVNTWGPNYAATLKAKAAELGLSTDQVNRMAGEAPKALLRLVGADAPPKTPAFSGAPVSSVQTGFIPTSGDRTKAWYDALKAKDPKLYYDKQTVVAMHKDATRLGERFFDT